MRLINIVLVLCLFLFPVAAFSQRTATDTDVQRDYMQGLGYYDAGLFGQAFDAFDRILHLDIPKNEPEFKLILTRAALYRAKSAVRLELPQGELMVLDFIQSHQPDPVATEATIEIAHYYFDERNYEKAITYYEMIDPLELTQKGASEVRFKEGYSHFVKKQFVEAEAAFASIKEVKNEYYYPSNYYYGMCRFFKADYPDAIRSFDRVENSQKYSTYVPYYITQIYFVQEDYQHVISYGESRINGPRVDNLKHIHHLVGQAYFETGDYAAALPHLEYYEQHSGKMRAEDFFQLAFVQYDQGMCDKSIPNFLSIANEKTAFGQRANFYLGDCYLKENDTRSARNAFRSVSRMTYDMSLQEEALFNYGKLSAELDFDFDAIQALDAIQPSSKFYDESQSILRDVFENTQDYASSLETLKAISSLSPALKDAHQRLSLLHGMQLFSDGDMQQAEEVLSDVQTYPVDKSLTARSLFWRAEIALLDGRHDQSMDLYNQYFTLQRNGVVLPPESSLPVANYNQGYNYLKIKNYSTALGHFQDAVAGLRQNRMNYNDTYFFNQLLPDAQLRAGDCLFKRNRYTDAMRFYQESIDGQKYGYVYAKYQKAIIQGLLNRPLDKILQLEDLVAQHPRSQFSDDALFNAAITYQELGNAEKALSALTKITSDYPSSDLINTANLRLGLISYNNGDLNASIAYYKRIFEGNPNASEAQEAITALEEIYVQDLARPTEYLAFVESIPGYQVSELKKDSISYRAAEIGYETGDYQRAITLFKAYIDQFPRGLNVLAAYYYRGESCTLLKRYDEAVADYDQVIKRGTSSFYKKALTNAASMSYHHQQDFETAFRYYRKLKDVTTDPKEAHEVLSGLMRSAYRTGHIEDANSAAIAVSEYADVTREQLSEAQFYLGKNAYGVKDYDHALQYFNKVTRNSNNVITAESRYLIAHIYYLRRQLELSEQLCHNANRESAQYPYWVAKSLLLLSDIYVDRNDLFNARAPLEALIENFEGEGSIVEEARRKLQTVDDLQAKQSRIKANLGDTLELDTTHHDKY